LNYENAMSDLAAQDRKDVEAQVFYALALLSNASPFDKMHARQKRAANLLEPLYQNFPNPFSQNTTIYYHLSDGVSNAQLIISDVAGAVVKTFTLNALDNGQVNIKDGELSPGVYFYSLIIDGKKVDAKQMTLTK